MTRVRISQLDGGAFPNRALMAIAHWHRQRGDEIVFVHGHKAAEPDVFGPYDRVYASAIFTFTAPLLAAFRHQWPDAVVGGTGSGSPLTVDQVLGQEPDGVDYGLMPNYPWSLGFTQRGCRLSCKFCVVPTKEGKPQSVSTIADIWRGHPYPRAIVLLDNDFFGQPADQWRARIDELRAGRFQVSFSQGVNVRMITDETAAALASVRYRSNDFQHPRLYTAWDNLKDEEVFFTGIDRLEAAGVPARHVMAYMLIGFDKRETWDRIWHRFNRMVDRGIKPYPMVYDRSREDLRRFQRWVVTAQYRKGVSFERYDVNLKRGSYQGPGLFDEAA